MPGRKAVLLPDGIIHWKRQVINYGGWSWSDRQVVPQIGLVAMLFVSWFYQLLVACSAESCGDLPDAWLFIDRD